MRWTTQQVLDIIGEQEDATYGNTLAEMVEFERKLARNKCREVMAECLNYKWEWFEATRTGKWVKNTTKELL